MGKAGAFATNQAGDTRKTDLGFNSARCQAQRKMRKNGDRKEKKIKMGGRTKVRKLSKRKKRKKPENLRLKTILSCIGVVKKGQLSPGRRTEKKRDADRTRSHIKIGREGYE